jgi:hypothetical protein
MLFPAVHGPLGISFFLVVEGNMYVGHPVLLDACHDFSQGVRSYSSYKYL